MCDKVCNILIVEDNEADADLIRRVLLKNDPALRLILLRDGEEALNLVQAGEPPLRPLIILLDLKLPKVSGLEVLQALKTNPQWRIMPVVMLTSSNQLRDIQQAYCLGANSYVLKAIDFDEFSAAISRIYQYWCHLNVPPELAA